MISDSERSLTIVQIKEHKLSLPSTQSITEGSTTESISSMLQHYITFTLGKEPIPGYLYFSEVLFGKPFLHFEVSFP